MILSLSIATVAWFSEKFTVWSYDCDTFQPKIGQCDGLSAAIKLGSLEKTVIASLFHSGLHSGTIFCGKNDVICYYLILGNNRLCRFSTKNKKQNILWCQIDFFVPTIFWSGAEQRFCFVESMSVLDQNGRIQAMGSLAWWQLTSHALNYNLP